MAYSRSIRHASRIGRYPWNIAMASRRALIASALRTLHVLGRWLGVISLWLLIGLLMIPTYSAHLVNGAGLDLIEKLKARADALAAELRGGSDA